MPDRATTRKAIEFFSIELAQLADGGYHVSLMANTVDDVEPQLLSQDITSERVASLDAPLAVIRAGSSEQATSPAEKSGMRNITGPRADPRGSFCFPIANPSLNADDPLAERADL